MGGRDVSRTINAAKLTPPSPFDETEMMAACDQIKMLQRPFQTYLKL
jgi:hypothetical protein